MLSVSRDAAHSQTQWSQKVKAKLLFFLIATGVSFVITGCATVPKESVALSDELTGMIRSAEAAHLALLDQYLAQRRERATEFMEKVWIPTFMSNAVKDTRILDSLDARHDQEEKEALLREFTEDASVQIQKRRASLIDAVDEVGRTLRESITAHYSQMLAVSQALTAHLESAANVTEARDQMLASLKVDLKKLAPLDEVNGVLDKVMTYGSKAEDIKKAVNEAKALIQGR
jgi:hypothetical protein